MNYEFTVPSKKRIRLIIDTDCKNEADGQFILEYPGIPQCGLPPDYGGLFCQAGA